MPSSHIVWPRRAVPSSHHPVARQVEVRAVSGVSPGTAWGGSSRHGRSKRTRKVDRVIFRQPGSPPRPSRSGTRARRFGREARRPCWSATGLRARREGSRPAAARKAPRVGSFAPLPSDCGVAGIASREHRRAEVSQIERVQGGDRVVDAGGVEVDAAVAAPAPAFAGATGARRRRCAAWRSHRLPSAPRVRPVRLSPAVVRARRRRRATLHRRWARRRPPAAAPPVFEPRRREPPFRDRPGPVAVTRFDHLTTSECCTPSTSTSTRCTCSLSRACDIGACDSNSSSRHRWSGAAGARLPGARRSSPRKLLRVRRLRPATASRRQHPAYTRRSSIGHHSAVLHANPVDGSDAPEQASDGCRSLEGLGVQRCREPADAELYVSRPAANRWNRFVWCRRAELGPLGHDSCARSRNTQTTYAMKVAIPVVRPSYTMSRLARRNRVTRHWEKAVQKSTKSPLYQAYDFVRRSKEGLSLVMALRRLLSGGSRARLKR